MSTQVGAISVGITAEVAQYLQQLVQVQRVTRNATEEMLALAQSQAKAQTSQQKHQASVKESIGSFTEFASALSLAEKAAKAVASGVEEAIGVANQFNPSGAADYTKQMRELKDQMTTVAAHVGEALRPVLMDLIGILIQLGKVAATVRLDRIWRDFLQGLREMWDGLKKFGSFLAGVVETWARLLAMPFDIMRDTIRMAFDAFAKGAMMMMRFQERLGLLDKETVDDAQTLVDGLSKALGTNIIDGAKSGFRQLMGPAGDFAEDFGKMLKEEYLGAASKTLHLYDDTDAASAKAKALQAEIAAIREQVAMKERGWALTTEAMKAREAEQRATADVKRAEDIAEIQKSKLEAAYSSMDTARIAAAQTEYALAMKAVAAKMDAEAAIFDKQKAAAEQSEKILKGQLILARMDLEAKAGAAERAAAASGATGLSGAAKAQADALVERTKKALDQAKTAYEQIGDREIQAAQQVENMRDKAEASRLEKRARQTRDEEESRKRAADYELRKREQLRAELTSLFQGSGVPGIANAYTDRSKTGYLGVDAGQKTDIPGLGGVSTAGLVGAIVEMLARSKQFQEAMGAVNEIMQAASDDLGAFMQPWLDIIKTLRDGLVPVMHALEPLIGAFAEVISPVVMILKLVVVPVSSLALGLSQVLSAIAPLIPPLVKIAAVAVLLISNIWQVALVVWLMGQALQALAPIIKKVVDSIGLAWNGLIDTLKGWLASLKDIPGVGWAAEQAAGELDSFKVHLDQAGTQTAAFADTMAQARRAFADYQDAQDRYFGLQQAADAAKRSGDPAMQALAEELQKQADQAYGDWIATSNQQVVDAAKAALQAYDRGDRSSGLTRDQLEQNLINAYAQQATSTAYNSTATKENTKATKDLAGSLSNVPTGFKLALERFRAIGAQTAIEAGATSGAASMVGARASAPGIVININIDRVAATADDVADAVDRAISNFTFRRTGTLAPQLPGGRFSTSGQS